MACIPRFCHLCLRFVVSAAVSFVMPAGYSSFYFKPLVGIVVTFTNSSKQDPDQHHVDADPQHCSQKTYWILPVVADSEIDWFD